ncbi:MULTISPECIES: phage major tail tube protein [Paenibacillus]|uniref:Phage tail protein n=1 Tax=Paenibacillus borealis TaxID=160799 RepID=A0ABX3H5X9_PAEBO|nr:MULTISPECIES: phage major tail tube protein [Paenibacillus]AIQ20730.1 hypothetical protein H70357_31745 [Paenibacillus sp. FSL H7-0357]OMD43891.1 hypothetical protein BSK56_23055 [Paenibacillus borealis]
MPNRSERIIDYSVFLSDQDRYLGTATATLPEITYLVETIKGGGISGEIEAPSPGHTGVMNLSLKWRTMEKEAVELMAPKVHMLTLRASIQTFNTSTAEYNESALKITVRARPLGLSLGNLEPATTMETTNNFSVSYLMVELNGERILEIDKYNYVHRVFDKDYLEITKRNLAL